MKKQKKKEEQNIKECLPFGPFIFPFTIPTKETNEYNKKYFPESCIDYTPGLQNEICMIEEYFKRYPNETACNIYCPCSRHRVNC